MAHFFPKQIPQSHEWAYQQAAGEKEMEIEITTKEGEYLWRSIKYEIVEKGNIGIVVKGAKNLEHYKSFSDRVKELLEE